MLSKKAIVKEYKKNFDLKKYKHEIKKNLQFSISYALSFFCNKRTPVSVYATIESYFLHYQLSDCDDESYINSIFKLFLLNLNPNFANNKWDSFIKFIFLRVKQINMGESKNKFKSEEWLKYSTQIRNAYSEFITNFDHSDKLNNALRKFLGEF
ncbi:hypothetical protein EI74_0598 [Mycoplasma testudineum]|uniref:Uncharacterized protein n=1 Tax=Mycoplasma testudineum TaxID=244584 RepID=A0A4R6ID23_9MOLU|nr:hypothetical protein [Mycoplasma testudineum]OYD26665.1 hypothetical protein CG473_02590 [Mycoplasma testudineum]TDO19794.1 hypothetical protein EI74_0598 [Mycoplasma testudineum]